jgi:hypothetical protein
MSETIDLTLAKVVAALRDTAEMATATETVRIATDHRWNGNQFVDGYSEQAHNKYSRDWIAGRLLGLADAIDAMLVKPEPSP